MRYKLNKKGNNIEVIISGQITYKDYDDLMNATSFLNDEQTKKCVINLTRVDFIDSIGFGMFLSLNELAEKNHKIFIIKGAKGMVKRVIEAIKFDEVIKVI